MSTTRKIQTEEVLSALVAQDQDLTLAEVERLTDLIAALLANRDFDDGLKRTEAVAEAVSQLVGKLAENGQVAKIEGMELVTVNSRRYEWNDTFLAYWSVDGEPRALQKSDLVGADVRCGKRNLIPDNGVPHRYQIGMQVIGPDPADEIIGRLTSVFREDGRMWGVINEEYEVELAGSAEVLDLTGRARANNPSLDASFLRLGNGMRRKLSSDANVDLRQHGYDVRPSRSQLGKFRWWRSTGGDGVSVPPEELSELTFDTERAAWESARSDAETQGFVERKVVKSDQKSVLIKGTPDQVRDQVENALAYLRSVIDAPVELRYGGGINIQVMPDSDDDRVVVTHTDMGMTTVNYTSEGLILDVHAQDQYDESVFTTCIECSDLSVEDEESSPSFGI